MDNSDDYFDDDDLVLDEATEAALVASERNYATQIQRQPQTPEEPLAKRQRTATGYTPAGGTPADSFNDVEFPEISIQGDGYYASAVVDTRQVQAPAIIQPRSHQQQPPSRQSDPQRQQIQRTSSSHSGTSSSGSTLRSSVHRHTSTSHTRYASPAPVQVAASAVTLAPVPQPVPEPEAAPSSTPALAIAQLQTQLDHLKRQLASVRRSNTLIQNELNEARNAKLARDGEVTILRKTMEKTAQTHAEELASLKNAKQEAEAKQTQIQKSLKEEMERLKTQLTFKQQELEASIRKPPGSVRPKRVRDPPATPLPSSSRWGVPLSQRANYPESCQRTPSKTIFAPVPKVSPTKKSPLKPKKAATLPGFQNSFATSTPLRPNHARSARAGERETLLDRDDGNLFNPPPPSLFATQSFSRPSPSKGVRSEPILPPPLPEARLSPPPIEPAFVQTPIDGDGDIVMDQEAQNEEDEYDVIEPPNWKAELSRIILTHVRPGCSHLSFRELLAVTFTGENQLDASQRYTSAYVTIMTSISQPGSPEGYDDCVKTVASSFSLMVEVLSEHNLTAPLASLLSLLATMSFFLPKFRTSLLFSSESDQRTTCLLLRSLCRVIATNLEPTASAADEGVLGRELLGFLETVALELSEDDALKFSDLVRNREVMMTLLNQAQPLPFLEQSLRVLVLLSTRKPLCWPLLSLPDPDRVEQRDPSARNGVTERLCSFLVEPAREGSKYYGFKENILLYFSQISIAHPSAYTTLGSLPLVLASIIWHTAHLTTPLYEDDEDLLDDADAASELVQYIYQAVYFIYYLMIKDKQPGSLGYKLRQAPQRAFSNIQHLHIVAFGRLAAAAPPDWLGTVEKKQLEEIKDMSSTILQEVVDGLELDGCYNAYTFSGSPEHPPLDEGELEDQMTRP